ncbi:MAG TPA: nucleoside-diphosphate sugar epimerase [Crenotrichaceae bacterium]|nr:nucleoside-diphosphate sugar epimerase [Crenotrichaceae bacterium]
MSDNNNPLIWLVLGDKRGDNAQVEIVEQALPWPCIRKHVQVKDKFTVKKPQVKPTIDHINLELSDSLQAPWPDIILTVGRRPSMVALWVKQQSAGLTRVILFGKPSSGVDDYDLIITSSEILMPPVSNVLTIDYPLMRVDTEAIETASKSWQSELSRYPKPLVAIMLGGPTKPYVYDQDTVQNIVIKTRQIIDQENGTPYLVTSRRTPDEFIHSLREQLPQGCELYQWNNQTEKNPYKALLGQADGFIVTEDSISMIIEIAKRGKPLALFPLSTGRLGWLDNHRRRLTGKLFSTRSRTVFDRIRLLLAKGLYMLGIARQVRDYRAFQSKLITQGYAVLIDQPLTKPDQPLVDELPCVVDTIVEFINDSGTQSVPGR